MKYMKYKYAISLDSLMFSGGIARDHWREMS